MFVFELMMDCLKDVFAKLQSPDSIIDLLQKADQNITIKDEIRQVIGKLASCHSSEWSISDQKLVNNLLDIFIAIAIYPFLEAGQWKFITFSRSVL